MILVDTRTECCSSRSKIFHTYKNPPSSFELILQNTSHFQGCASTPKVTSPCTSSEFECRDRITCVHKAWVCDGDRDCPDGGDEAAEICRGNVTCRIDQFQCRDHSCIPGALYCNGDKDCPDGSDEMNCSKSSFQLPFSRYLSIFSEYYLVYLGNC